MNNVTIYQNKLIIYNKKTENQTHKINDINKRRIYIIIYDK